MKNKSKIGLARSYFLSLANHGEIIISSNAQIVIDTYEMLKAENQDWAAAFYITDMYKEMMKPESNCAVG